MSSKKPTSRGSKTEDVRFIGVSIEDFLAETSKEVKAGQFSDGTTIHPKVRDALSQFTKSLAEPRLRIQYYVFAFSRHVFIKISF